jgi:ribosome biogenesis GTPase A
MDPSQDKKYEEIFNSIKNLESSIKNKNYRRIWVYGSTQAGKSSFVNAYMGR